MERRYGLRVHLAGATVARIGDDMSGPALLLAGFAVAGSAAEASSLLAGLTVAAAVGGPVLGVLLDRAVRPGRVLAVALALYGAGLAVVLTGLGRWPVAVTLLIAVVTGLFGPALAGGWTAQLPRVAPSQRLPRATALDAMTFSAAGLAGPALAGGAAELLGAPAAVVVSVVLIGLALPAAWRLPTRAGTPPQAAPVAGAVVAGLRCIVRHRPLAAATLVSVVSCTAEGMLVACAPVLGERVLGAAGHGTMLLSCVAVSALAANAALARFPAVLAPDTIVWAGALVQATALALAATGHPALVIAAALVAGAGEGPQLTALFAVRHREAPDHLRGQIFTTGASLKITGFAVGAAVAGPLASRSLSGALVTAAGVSALAALAHFAVAPCRRGRSEADLKEQGYIGRHE
ncbi:MFS transporter [Streptomyces sp. TRM68367]|uniref:MFS transporter n=1 Tax=Streptomyces sp. TRM68367 TaxID=2758415 RepID=UPI00165B8D9C|nr:MFS transporter [Streptomyces sp. TRM68367]MBC9728963.1 MFS transporter [Streptomyces sp. TRM68367]